MAKFGIDSNMVFDTNGKSVATRLSDHDNSLSVTNQNVANNVAAIGILSQLNTTDKSSIVNALTEIKSQANLNGTTISGLNAGPKGVYATLSALQTAFSTGATGIYLTTDTGHWYYWNGTAWIDGGVYQPTGISDGSITVNKLETSTQSVIGNAKTSLDVFSQSDIYDSITSGLNMTNTYYTIPNYKILKGNSIDTVTMYSAVASQVEIVIFNGTAPNLTFEKKFTFTTAVGVNTFTIGYTPQYVNDTYIGFHTMTTGGITYVSGYGTFYNNYYEITGVSSPIAEGQTRTFSLNTSVSANFNFKVHLKAIKKLSDIETEISGVQTIVNKRIDVQDVSTLLNVSSTSPTNVGTGYYLVPNYKMSSGTYVNKVTVYSPVAGSVEILFFSGSAITSLTLDKKITANVIVGMNDINIGYKLPHDSYIGLNTKTNGALSYNTSGNTFYSSYYQATTANINVGDTNTFTSGGVANATFNLSISIGTDGTFSSILSDIVTLKGNQSTPVNVLSGKKYASFGDSITSDQVSGTGTIINGSLGTSLIGNFATGWSTCSDWHTGTTNNTVITLATPNNTDTNDNVLSNQVRRILQRTTASGSQITWTHPIDGAFSLDTSVGTGLGFTTDIPDIIYIAIGTNDGKNASVPINDDTDVIFGQTYSQLTRNSIASALRWAIETLQCVYPKANIFVASPLQTNCGNSWMSFTNNKSKRDIIDKVCQFTSVHFVDSFNNSGFSTIKSKTGVLTVDGIHPNTEGKNWLSNFVSGQINKRFVIR